MTMIVTMLMFRFQWDEKAESTTVKTLAARFDRVYGHCEFWNL